MAHDYSFQLPGFADLPAMREFLAAWNKWRAGKLVPHRADVNLDDIKASLRQAMLFDMELDGRIHCRYMGSVFQEIYGQDFTGQNYLDITEPQYRKIRSWRLFSVVRHPCIAVWATSGEPGDARLPKTIGASVPIVPEGEGRAMQLMQVIVQLDDVLVSAFANKPKRGEVQISDRFSFVDLGAGCPAAE